MKAWTQATGNRLPLRPVYERHPKSFRTQFHVSTGPGPFVHKELRLLFLFCPVNFSRLASHRRPIFHRNSKSSLSLCSTSRASEQPKKSPFQKRNNVISSFGHVQILLVKFAHHLGQIKVLAIKKGADRHLKTREVPKDKHLNTIPVKSEPLERNPRRACSRRFNLRIPQGPLHFV